MTAVRAYTKIYSWKDDFFGNRKLTSCSSSSPEQGSGLSTVIVHTSGSPTAVSLSPSDSGILRLACDNTSEVQSIGLYQGDVLSYSVASESPTYLGGQGALRTFRAKVNVSGNDSHYVGFVGMSAANNSTLSSMTRVGFEITGSEIYARTYDGTTDSTAIDTGYAVAGNPLLFEINLEDPTNVKFYLTRSDGTWDRVCKQTIFAIPALEGDSLQLNIRNGKSTGTSVCVADIDVVEINGRRL